MNFWYIREGDGAGWYFGEDDEPEDGPFDTFALAVAAFHRHRAYHAANRRHPLPLSGEADG